MAEKKSIELVDFVKQRIGTPYFYGSKGSTLTESYMETMHKRYPKVVTVPYMLKARLKKIVGKVCVDCSGLIYMYTRKNYGSAQLYQKAYTRLPISEYKKFADGVVVWREGHVGVFYSKNGSYFVIEAKGIDYGTVCSDFDPKKWTCGLTFDWMSYIYNENLSPQSTWRGINPYKEPTLYITSKSIAKKKKFTSYFSEGEGVKWVQWELCQAGYEEIIKKAGGIDGVFGSATEKALIAFQKSCKIDADGICGSVTRKYLKADV